MSPCRQGYFARLRVVTNNFPDGKFLRPLQGLYTFWILSHFAQKYLKRSCEAALLTRLAVFALPSANKNIAVPRTCTQKRHIGAGFGHVRPVGFEPTTKCLKGICSTRLSYGRMCGEYTTKLPERNGFVKAVSCQLKAILKRQVEGERAGTEHKK